MRNRLRRRKFNGIFLLTITAAFGAGELIKHAGLPIYLSLIAGALTGLAGLAVDGLLTTRKIKAASTETPAHSDRSD